MMLPAERNTVTPPKPRAPEKSLYDVTLIGPGDVPLEFVRVTQSEVIALEKKGYTVHNPQPATGQSTFAEASLALGRLLRHAELTDNAELQAKANDAIQALLRGNRLMSGGTGSANKERTQTLKGVAPQRSKIPGARRR